jgi:hypothetical protein
MNEQIQTVDLLTQLVRRVRPVVANGDVHGRIRALWAAAKFAHLRNLAAADVITEHLMALAIDAGLIDRRGCWDCAGIAEHRRPYGRQDVAHAVDWALRGAMNPFAEGPLYDA